AAARAAQHLDAHALLGAGVVRHVQVGIHLDHRSTPCLTRPDPTRLAKPQAAYGGVPVCSGVGGGGAGAAVRAPVTTRTPGPRRRRCVSTGGRAPLISPVSPTCASFCSSGRGQIVRRLMSLPWRWCLPSRGIPPRRVLFILSLVTTPTSTRRLPRFSSFTA